MCPREPIRHPAWCDPAACTVGRELVCAHWSRPWRVERSGAGYPLIELRLWLDGDQPVDEPPAVELRLILLEDGCPVGQWGTEADAAAVARYDVDASMLLALASAAIDVARRFTGDTVASGTPVLSAPGGAR